MDCLEGMKQLEDNSVDLIITSPPYEDISGAGYKANKKDILFFKLYSDFVDKVFNEYFRILKSNGQIFFNIKSKTHNKTLSTVHWLEFLESFKQFKLKSYIIWKYAGSFDSTKKRFHLDYEIIYHLSKGDDIYLNTECGIHDPLTSIWYVPHNIKDRLHPTQMPILLVERILKVASKPNDLILDNFMGSGTTAVACKQLGRNFIGFEISEEYCKIANKRLEQTNLTSYNV
jgi:DNA modification methylase|tara:strand:+ start:369 stop:1058 length:690 start_codon:yes stop_codon:yes gene_type:complete